ncbi:MAG: beta-ketoacyl synthase chain length factor [Spongiibacteraceae bacterium]
MPAIEFSIQRWGVWPPADELAGNSTLNLDFVPALMRRRLSPLAKAVFSAVSACVGSGEQIPLLCSSAHGEIQRTAEILNDISAGNGVSPTAFSLSVHNAIAGQLSIALKNCAPIAALAPTQQGMLPVLLEAVGLLNERAEDVVIALFDEPLPESLATFAPRIAAAQCVAIRIGRRRENGGFEQILRLSEPPADVGASAMVSVDDLSQFLSTGGASARLLCVGDSTWEWRRRHG